MKNLGILEKLRQLLKYKTVSGNVKEFNKLFNYIKSLIPSNLYISENSFNGKPTMVISNTPSKNLDYIFCTHVDVVPCNNYDCYIKDNIMYGRGTFDMKGNVAVCLELITKNISDKKIALFITTDEEIDGNCVKQLMEDYTCKLAIVPDGGSNFKLIEEEKGLIQLKLSINTISAHASQLYDGVNAITQLYSVYSNLIKKYPIPVNEKDYRTSINLSKLNGGTANNSVPDYAEMVIDIRTTLTDKLEDFTSLINKLNNNIKIEVLTEGPVFKTNLNDALVKKYVEISKNVLSSEIEIIKCTSTSDAIYFSNKDIPTIIMNPVGGNAHGPNEYIDLSSLDQLYEIYQEFIK